MLRVELERLAHKDVRQRRIAIRRLFEIDNAAALPAFINLLEDPDEWFQGKAVDALRRWVDDSNRTVILRLSSSKNGKRRMLSAELAPRLGSAGLDILSNLCQDADVSVLREAWRGRLSVDTGSIPVAIEADDHVVRRMAVERSGDEGLLLAALDDAHSRVQAAATLRLNELGHKVEVDVISLCAEATPQNRRLVAASLEDIDWAADAELLQALSSSEDTMLLPRLLRSKRGPSYDEIRLSLLSGDDSMVISRVLEHLHGREVTSEVRAKVENLSDSDDELIAATAQSLLADTEALGAGV